MRSAKSAPKYSPSDGEAREANVGETLESLHGLVALILKVERRFRAFQQNIAYVMEKDGY